MWVTADDFALLVDLYELTMLQAYLREDMHEEAVFSLFVRRLPDTRNFLVAAGLDDALESIETIRFTAEALDYLAGQPQFSSDLIDWLANFRFTGTVRAVPEGTPIFGGEPILEVIAPLPEAQLLETIIMNQVHLQTVLASKAARVKLAAGDRTVVDFGLRRIHGVDAGLKSARAFYIAGVDATSNVLAGRVYGIPVTGTLAHSYIQAHDAESDAFRAFTHVFPKTTLLVDTYDTLDGVRSVIALARELGDAFRVRAVRLDSGDLAALAHETRALLDDAELTEVEIFASGSLDENVIASIIDDDAPIDGFGVGTSMGVAVDAPALDVAYKLTEYAGTGRLKLSTGKHVLPGRKQIFRQQDNGEPVRDVIARADELLAGRPLLEEVMVRGQRLPAGRIPLERSREHAHAEIAALPARIRSLSPADPPFPVQVSDALEADRQAAVARVRASLGETRARRNET